MLRLSYCVTFDLDLYGQTKGAVFIRFTYFINTLSTSLEKAFNHP